MVGVRLLPCRTRCERAPPRTTPALVGLWRDQGEPAFRVVSLTQVHGTVRQHDLKRRPNMTLQQMARNRAATSTCSLTGMRW